MKILSILIKSSILEYFLRISLINLFAQNNINFIIIIFKNEELNIKLSTVQNVLLYEGLR